jgi:hypothetical protein
VLGNCKLVSENCKINYENCKMAFLYSYRYVLAELFNYILLEISYIV